MPEQDESESLYKKWGRLIKADKVKEVLDDVTETHIDGEKALECLVYISQLAYKDVQNGVPFSSLVEDTARLTRMLSAAITPQPRLCNLRFITSLYHIAFFFYKKSQFEYVQEIYKIILKTKEADINIFRGGGGTQVYNYFKLLLQKVIPKLVNNENSNFNNSKTKEFFCIFLKLLTENNEVENGSMFLDTVLLASQVVGKKDKNLAIVLICGCLQLFPQEQKLKDVDSVATIMFKLFSSLFHLQLEKTGYASALGLVLSHVETNKWKFGEQDVHHGECFYLMSQAKMFKSSQSEITVRKMIQNAVLILDTFDNSEHKKDYMKETCLLLTHLISNLKESKTVKSSALFGPCFGPFLEMVMKLCSALTRFNVDRFYPITCLSMCILLISEGEKTKKHVLKNNVQQILKTETVTFESIQKIRSENHEKADNYTKYVLSRYAQLIRSYHLCSLQEEIIAVAKPFCKFGCTVPSYIFDDNSSKISLEVGFSCLIQALGLANLYEVLEVATAWLIVCPESSRKIFRHWGDMKHNALCANSTEFLDTNIYTIVTEGKASLEEKWLPYKLTESQLGNFLVKEMNTYFTNKSLRGSPLLETVKALECLATDDLTQAKGLVVALDVTSAKSEYSEQCDHYHSRIEQTLQTLRKQKNHLDPVDFHCCIGDLLFSQFRFKLKSFRSSCEGEVLRLSALRKSVGPLIPQLPEERPDPNDTCDVTVQYSNLSLDKQIELLANLEGVVEQWKAACEHLTKNGKTKNSTYDLRVTLKNLQDAALIMKLYCDEDKESEILNICYNMACQTNEADNILIAVSEIIQTRSFDKNVLHRAEDILNKSELSDRIIKHAFLINKALLYLKINQLTEGVKILEREIKEKNRLPTVLFISCLIIVGLYQKLNVWRQHGKFCPWTPSNHFSFHKALTHLLYVIEQEKWNSFVEASQIQLYIFEVSYLLGETYWGMVQPREARCYLGSQLPLAQKLGLPLRTAQLLLLLTWVDLSTGSMADCMVKLEGLEALLNLQGAPASFQEGADSPNKLNKEQVWNPDFLGHRSGCDCFVCRCVEYQRLVLETLTLRAVFCANNNRLPQALQCFKVAMNVQKFLSKSKDTKVLESSARMWKHYADTLALSNKTIDSVLSENKKALNTLPTEQNNSILLQHILHQKFGLQNLTNLHNKPIGPRIVMKTEETRCSPKTPTVVKPEPARPDVHKTPLSIVSGNITPNFVRPVRKFVLSPSGDENTPPIPKSVSKSERRIKPPQKLKIETPQNTKFSSTVKTPFTVFDDDENTVGEMSSKKTTWIKKETESKTFKPTHKSLVSSMSPNKETDGSVIFKSPVRKSNRKPRMNVTKICKLINDGLSGKTERASKNENVSKEGVNQGQDGLVISKSTITKSNRKPRMNISKISKLANGNPSVTPKVASVSESVGGEGVNQESEMFSFYEIEKGVNKITTSYVKGSSKFEPNSKNSASERVSKEGVNQGQDEVILKSPIRKSNRRPKMNISKISKLANGEPSVNPKVTSASESVRAEGVNQESEMFSFDEIEKEVNKISRSYVKGSSKFEPNSKNKTRSQPGPKQDEVDSDCSMVEATPSPPRRNIRKTRTRKV